MLSIPYWLIMTTVHSHLTSTPGSDVGSFVHFSDCLLEQGSPLIAFRESELRSDPLSLFPIVDRVSVSPQGLPVA